MAEKFAPLNKRVDVGQNRFHHVTLQSLFQEAAWMMSYWMTVHLNVHHCLNTASIPHCIKGVICFHNWVSPKSRNRTLECCFVCSYCTKNNLPMWIRLGHARLSLNMTIRDTDFFSVSWFSISSTSVTLRITVHSFQILQPGKRWRSQSKGFLPLHAHTLALHTQTYTLPQKTKY